MNTDTPRTDDEESRIQCDLSSMKLDDWNAAYHEMKEHAQKLERELTAAREELKAVTIERDEFHVKIEELAIKLQAVTEQRDKLAELSGFGEFDKP